MRRIKLFKMLAILLVFISFKSDSISYEEIFIGEYGICNLENTRLSSLRLSLESNHTFKYLEVISSTETISSTGTWTVKDNTIILLPVNAGNIIPLNWKSDSDARYLKARKGLKYYRICNLKSCK
jgi:hypothetical protein